MVQFLEILSLIVKLLPLIKETVIALEGMFPDSGTGAAKKALLNNVLDQAIDASSTLAATYAAAKPALQVIIDTVVAVTKGKPVGGV